MKVVILCGGIGSRLNDYSFPKPLNMIYGVPAISYTLKYLPEEIRTIYFVVSPHLARFNFCEIVVNQFKDRNCVFLPLGYFTRGPIESAWCGTQGFEETDESILFLDNDVLYKFPEGLFHESDSAFLGYSVDKTDSEAYSFIQLRDGLVTNIQEKKRISEHFICGVYGFRSIKQFRDVAHKVLTTPLDGELYLSMLYSELLRKGESVKGVQFNDEIAHIGSLKELLLKKDVIPKRNMRICFDLDNTLVTYPTVPGDYTTVKPIEELVAYARKLHAEGHTIIIYTARRMQTHKHNVGAVLKDIGKVTFDTLEKYNIPCDEIVFGKPIADMYIDDRSVNPYRNDMACMGLLNFDVTEAPINKLNNNKYNSIELEGGHIVKRGLTKFLQGEIYFYKNIPKSLSLSSHFPTFYGSVDCGDRSEIRTEYIRGVPLYTLYHSELLTETHIMRLFDILDCLHASVGSDIPEESEVRANYVDKCKMRFRDTTVYPFETASKYQDICLKQLETYLLKTPKIASIIHGDFWLSNILLDFKNNIKLIDMKGRLESRLTLGGDVMYDYGKLYQSVLGYDLVLNNHTVKPDYSRMIQKIFIREFLKRGYAVEDLWAVTISLMMGSFHSIDLLSTRTTMWNWLTTLMDSYP